MCNITPPTPKTHPKVSPMVVACNELPFGEVSIGQAGQEFQPRVIKLESLLTFTNVY